MFEDLVPPAPAQPPAPPPGVFDDLIAAGTPAAAAGKLAAPGGAGEPALPRSTAGTDPGDASIAAPARNGELALAPSDQTNARDDSPPAAGSFDDLIPAAARRGGAVGGQQGALAPPYEPVPDPSLGLKDAKTGIPLVRESMPGRFIADVAGEDDGGLFWHDPKTGEIQRPSGNELIQAEGGKYKVYERDENIRPWTWTDMALIQAIKSGFTAPYDALAGNMAPNEVIPRALDFASFAGGRSPVTTWRPRARPTPVRPEPVDQPPSQSFSDNGPPREAQNAAPGATTPEGQGATRDPTSVDPGAAQSPNDHPPNEGGTGTGPPSDEAEPSQNGAPSGAVSNFGDRVAQIPSQRLAGRPRKPGQAPIGDDGHPIELHHHDQVQDGPISELTRNDHRIGKNYKLNHPNTGQKASLIDRVLFRRQRLDYWKGELRKGRFDNLPELSKTEIEELRRASKARMNSPERRSNE